MSFLKNIFKKKKTPTVLVQRVMRELDYIANPESAPPERKVCFLACLTFPSVYNRILSSY